MSLGSRRLLKNNSAFFHILLWLQVIVVFEWWIIWSLICWSLKRVKLSLTIHWSSTFRFVQRFKSLQLGAFGVLHFYLNNDWQDECITQTLFCHLTTSHDGSTCPLMTKSIAVQLRIKAQRSELSLLLHQDDCGGFFSVFLRVSWAVAGCEWWNAAADSPADAGEVRQPEPGSASSRWVSQLWSSRPEQQTVCNFLTIKCWWQRWYDDPFLFSCITNALFQCVSDSGKRQKYLL